MNLCFDFGGMSTKVAMFENDKIIHKDVIEYEKNKQIDAITLLGKLINYISNTKLLNKVNNICISSSGLVDSKTGNISGLSAIANLNKVNFIKELEKKFNIKTYIENDGKCATLAEIKKGNAVKFDNVLIIVVGTGIGGGIVIDKKIHKGSNLIAGDIGYFFQHKYNGIYTNLSEVSGMHFLTTKYNQMSGNVKSGKEIYDDYFTDNNAKDVIDKQIFNLSRAILNISFTIDMDVVLIGGAISSNELFLQLLNDKVGELYSESGMKQNFKIDKCKFWNDSNLIGANQLPTLGEI